MMGAHLRIAYAPLKRFTDLVVAKMMGVSPSGNAALSLVLRAMLTSIGDAPVKGVKKLVAIAEEVGKG
jgi:Na+/H+-dicarboxylate symporter